MKITKKNINKLEDIENEIDSLKTKKLGRPVGSKTKKFLGDIHNGPKYEDAWIVAGSVVKSSAGSEKDYDKAWEDFMIPTPKELGMHRGNSGMSLTNKITLVLTAVNVGILISLVIKNV